MNIFENIFNSEYAIIGPNIIEISANRLPIEANDWLPFHNYWRLIWSANKGIAFNTGYHISIPVRSLVMQKKLLRFQLWLNTDIEFWRRSKSVCKLREQEISPEEVSLRQRHRTNTQLRGYQMTIVLA